MLSFLSSKIYALIETGSATRLKIKNHNSLTTSKIFLPNTIRIPSEHLYRCYLTQFNFVFTANRQRTLKRLEENMIHGSGSKFVMTLSYVVMKGK
jgi:hypothetical protein